MNIMKRRTSSNNACFASFNTFEYDFTDFSNYDSGVKICYVNLIDMFYTRIRAMQKDCCHDLYNHRDSSLLF